MSVQKSTSELDWDGLRYFHALARAGSLSGVARELRVQHTTVSRQLQALEASLGARLFLRSPRGYTLTRVGQALLESVQAMHAQVQQVTRLAAGQDVEMSGVVRVATADALAKHVVLPAVQRLQRQHTGLGFELVSDTRQHDLSRREADIALRIGSSNDTELVGKRLLALGFGLYSARPRPRKLALNEASYVTFDEVVGKLPHQTWLAEHAPNARVVLRSNRQETLTEAVRLGVGLGILPCIVADKDAKLRRWLGPEQVFSRDLWLLTHADLHGSRRVRAMFDAIASYVEEHRAELGGVETRATHATR